MGGEGNAASASAAAFAEQKRKGPSCPSLLIHETMFQNCSELLHWRDLESPFSAHPTLFHAWKEEADSALEEAIDSAEIEMTEQEESSFAVAKEVGYLLLEKFATRARAVGWASQPASLRKAAVEALLQLPQIPQRTPEWYTQGKQVLTASEFATLFKTPRAVSQLVLTKAVAGSATGSVTGSPPPLSNRLACLTCEMGPFDWGIRFEPVVKQVLEKEGVLIAESGRLLHPKDTHLAASPDGLILEAADPRRVGRLVEIKCPISRKIGEGIPFEYWCQMQIQMEVTGIGECEYIEVKIQSIQKEATELPGGHEPQGYLWLLQNPTTAEMTYAYEDLKRIELEADGWDLLETIPWRIEKWVREVVARDSAWFKGTKEVRDKFWTDVAAAREGSYKAVEGRQKQLRVIVTKEQSIQSPLGMQATPSQAHIPCLILDDEDAPNYVVPNNYDENQVPSVGGGEGALPSDTSPS